MRLFKLLKTYFLHENYIKLFNLFIFMTTEIKQILEELKVIKLELDEIRDNMPDKELFLTREEKQLLEESYKNEKEGNLISSKELRKKLQL